MSGWRSVRASLRGPRSDVAVLATTFLLTVLFDLTIAIELGLLLSMLLFMRRMVESTKILVSRKELALHAHGDDGHHGTQEVLTLPDGVEVYEIDGPFFFGIANRFEELVIATRDRPKVRILRMRFVPFMDSTAVRNLHILVETSRTQGVQLVLSGVNPRVRATLEATEIADLIGERYICSDIHQALEAAQSYISEDKENEDR